MEQTCFTVPGNGQYLELNSMEEDGLANPLLMELFLASAMVWVVPQLFCASTAAYHSCHRVKVQHVQKPFRRNLSTISSPNVIQSPSCQLALAGSPFLCPPSREQGPLLLWVRQQAEHSLQVGFHVSRLYQRLTFGAPEGNNSASSCGFDWREAPAARRCHSPICRHSKGTAWVLFTLSLPEGAVFSLPSLPSNMPFPADTLGGGNAPPRVLQVSQLAAHRSQWHDYASPPWVVKTGATGN